MTDDTEWRAEPMTGYSGKTVISQNRWRVVSDAPGLAIIAEYLDEPTARLIAAAGDMQEALIPFALFFSALERATDIESDNHLEPVLKMGHQALTVGAFTNALEALAKSRPQT